jgi:hypothetical protein
MNQLKSFNHNQFGELQVIVINGKKYFGASKQSRNREISRKVDI